MQPFYLIHNRPCYISHHRIVNRHDIRHHRADAARLHALVCAHAHAAAQQGCAVGDRFCHLQVLIVLGGVHAVWLLRLALDVRLVGEVGMPNLAA